MKNYAPIEKLPINCLGKDYVVGDLHGCFTLLERLLENVGFDTTCDRLFSVGDLIDRGPNSLRCLQLLDEPWFYAVQGNHELMMLNFFLPYFLNGKLKSLEDISGMGFMAFGGDWIEEYFEPEKQRMTAEFNRCLAMVQEMPLIWVVGEGQSRFHVIHGELVNPDNKSSTPVVWLDSDLDRWLEEQAINPNVQDRLYWGRTLMLRKSAVLKYAKIQRGLSTTFCGHTIAARPRQVLSHLCVDTGAFVSIAPDDDEIDEDYGLTLFDVQTSRWVSTSYQRDEVIWGEFPTCQSGG